MIIGEGRKSINVIARDGRFNSRRVQVGSIKYIIDRIKTPPMKNAPNTVMPNRVGRIESVAKPYPIVQPHSMTQVKPNVPI